MILQALHAAHERLAADPAYEIAPMGYSVQKVTFKVVLTSAGQLFRIEDARSHREGKPRAIRVRVLGGTKPSGSGLNPCLLWDNSAYLLGYKPKDKKPDRTRASFEAFRGKHLELSSEIGCPTFDAVCRFLREWDPGILEHAEYLEYREVLDEGSQGFGVFQLRARSEYVHQGGAIQKWWDAREVPRSDSQGQCLITGEHAAIAETHPKIKGVMGAQPAGATIAGYNAPAYESYGKKQSLNAPVGEEAAFRYVAALNAFLDGPMQAKHRARLGDTTIAFWTERPTLVEDVLLPFFGDGGAPTGKGAAQDEGVRQKVGAFLAALRKGREAYGDLDGSQGRTMFYMLGLAPNRARIAIRFFHSGTLAELAANVRRHHHDIRLLPRWPSDPEFPPAWRLLQQSARDRNEVPPSLGGPLLRSIVAGSPYPQALYAAVLRRVTLGDPVDYLRGCVIKGYLNRNLRKELDMALDATRSDPAYRLGRLFAALEKTQKDALGEGLNKTIRDSYYGSASSTPGVVFPRLLRTYQHHLAKLPIGHKVNREKLVQAIIASLGAFPSSLTLPDQGLFAIGYYHQTCDFYVKRDDDDNDAANE